MLRSDEVFSILFVHILLVKKLLRLLFDSSSYLLLVMHLYVTWVPCHHNITHPCVVVRGESPYMKGN
jgi:hypothetical protein